MYSEFLYLQNSQLSGKIGVSITSMCEILKTVSSLTMYFYFSLSFLLSTSLFY